MENENNYIKLGDLLVYKLAIELSKYAWEIYENLDWREKKIMGDQFIRSVDSVGANIAEGYGRYHYLDKIKFYYNARGSLLETKHWIFLLNVRGIVSSKVYKDFFGKANNLHAQINRFIGSTYDAKLGN